jgi:hypothetical protein
MVMLIKTQVLVSSFFLSVSSFPLILLFVLVAVLFLFSSVLLFPFVYFLPIDVLVLFLPDAVALHHPLLSLLAVLLLA